MKPKTFFFLLIIVLALGGGIWLSGGRQAPVQDSRMGEKVFTDLDATRIEAITLQSAAQTVRLEKQEVWVVTDRDNYPADFGKITDMVRRLTAAKMGSSFEATPENRRHLGLLDPAEARPPEAGLRIIFDDRTGHTLLDIIVGRAREASVGTGGHYLLPTGASRGYMVDQNFLFVGRQAVDWLEKDLLNVSADDIETVECIDPQTGAVCYTLSRPEAYADPAWMQATPGDTLRTSRFDAVFRNLIALSLDDVTAATPELLEQAFANRSTLTYLLYDGTRYTVFPGSTVAEDSDVYYLKIEADWQPPAQMEENADLLTEEEATTLQQAARDLNARLAPWVFMVPSWKYNNFITDPTEFIQPPENVSP